jgi:hypothetical protein
MKNSMILILLFFVGCGQQVSETRTPRPTKNTEELLDSPVVVFMSEMNQMNQDQRGADMPTLGEWIEYSVEYNLTKELQFEIKDEGEEFTCKYKFTKATIKETITKVEIKDYSISKVIIPVEPTYDGAEITSWKEKCLVAMNAGAKVVPLDFSIDAQLTAFKKFVRTNFIDPVQKCMRRTPPVFYTCKLDSIEVVKSSNSLIDFYSMNFQARVKGKAIGIKASINFEKVYFSNYGIFGFAFDSLNPVGFSGITKLTLRNWRKLER